MFSIFEKTSQSIAIRSDELYNDAKYAPLRKDIETITIFSMLDDASMTAIQVPYFAYAYTLHTSSVLTSSAVVEDCDVSIA